MQLAVVESGEPRGRSRSMRDASSRHGHRPVRRTGVLLLLLQAMEVEEVVVMVIMLVVLVEGAAMQAMTSNHAGSTTVMVGCSGVFCR